MIELLLPAAGIGFIVGFRHAFEPDHLAAVTTLAARERGHRRAARLGLAWGLGHTASVAIVATVLIVLGIRVPQQFYQAAELGVAVLLIVLGISAIMAESRRHRRSLGASHDHARVAEVAHAHPDALRSVWRAAVFGVAHGLAGSGAVVVLLVAASSRLAEQISYLAAFGVGTIAGMSLVSLLTGAAAVAVADRHGRVAQGVRLGAAGLSVIIGVLLGVDVLGAM